MKIEPQLQTPWQCYSHHESGGEINIRGAITPGIWGGRKGDITMYVIHDT